MAADRRSAVLLLPAAVPEVSEVEPEEGEDAGPELLAAVAAEEARRHGQPVAPVALGLGLLAGGRGGGRRGGGRGDGRDDDEVAPVAPANPDGLGLRRLVEVLQ